MCDIADGHKGRKMILLQNGQPSFSENKFSYQLTKVIWQKPPSTQATFDTRPHVASPYLQYILGNSSLSDSCKHNNFSLIITTTLSLLLWGYTFLLLSLIVIECSISLHQSASILFIQLQSYALQLLKFHLTLLVLHNESFNISI